MVGFGFQFKTTQFQIPLCQKPELQIPDFRKVLIVQISTLAKSTDFDNKPKKGGEVLSLIYLLQRLSSSFVIPKQSVALLYDQRNAVFLDFSGCKEQEMI